MASLTDAGPKKIIDLILRLIILTIKTFPLHYDNPEFISYSLLNVIAGISSHSLMPAFIRPRM